MSPASPATHAIVHAAGCHGAVFASGAAFVALLDKAIDRLGDRLGAPLLLTPPRGPWSATATFASGHVAVHADPADRVIDATISAATADLAAAAAHHLVEGLADEQPEIVLVEGGPPVSIPDHAPVATVAIDCRAAALPAGVCVGPSPGRGLGLFVTRDVAAGEPIYDACATLVPWNAELTILTDHGPRRHTGDSWGYELGADLLARLPSTTRRRIAQRFDLASGACDAAVRALTSDWERSALVIGFDGMVNHAADPNSELDWAQATIAFEPTGHPRFRVARCALRPLTAGQELRCDYRATLPDFFPPPGWQP